MICGFGEPILKPFVPSVPAESVYHGYNVFICPESLLLFMVTASHLPLGNYLYSILFDMHP